MSEAELRQEIIAYLSRSIPAPLKQALNAKPGVMNVYSMYRQNGCKTGFWVRRNSWGQTIARVVHVDPLDGFAPYYGNPAVYADYFRWNTQNENWVLVSRNEKLSCPGTYAYARVPKPKRGVICE